MLTNEQAAQVAAATYALSYHFLCALAVCYLAARVCTLLLVVREEIRLNKGDKR